MRLAFAMVGMSRLSVFSSSQVVHKHLAVIQIVRPIECTGDDVVEDAGLLPKCCAAALAMALAALQRLASGLGGEFLAH
jgi:hypothetical protein